jgi:hypothetical protein
MTPNRPAAEPGTVVDLRLATELRLASAHYATVISHGRRKLQGPYLDGETPEQQAFGLLAGRMVEHTLHTTHVFPLTRNMRHEPRFSESMDSTVHALGVPSKTPLARRGWIADPRELFSVHRRCDEEGVLVYGSYHMHKVGWSHDPLRDTPTALDRALVDGQGIWMLILSLVDPERPILRGFFEGSKEREAPIAVGPTASTPRALS